LHAEAGGFHCVSLGQFVSVNCVFSEGTRTYRGARVSTSAPRGHPARYTSAAARNRIGRQLAAMHGSGGNTCAAGQAGSLVARLMVSLSRPGIDPRFPHQSPMKQRQNRISKKKYFVPRCRPSAPTDSLRGPGIETES
jgi:hypothetical protein